MIKKTLTVASAALLFAACASAPAPRQLSVDTAASIRSAEELSAHENPEASLHLELARRGYDDAKALMEDGDHEAAKAKLERARADAELAIVLAKAEDARKDASRELARVQKLEKEIR